MYKMNQTVDFNVKDIVVPEDILYIDDWKEYRLEDYPFPHILNKVLTGCGYTEFCLRNLQNIILLSPRKFLLENKRDQHCGELNILYAENISEKLVDYEKDISKEDKKIVNRILSDTEKESLRKSILNLKNRVNEHWEFCKGRGLPCKILVTYDSFRHVMEALGEDIKNFQIVVDEFQSIFIDARFKSEAELELMNHINTLQSKYRLTRVCFVSATPMLERYLVQLDEFKNLPYYRFDWETASPGRTKKPKIDIKYTSRPLSEHVNNVIEKYRSGKFESRVIVEGDDKKIVESKEAVLFFNSVKGICQAIRTNNLLPSECNILCANTPDNEKRIKSVFNEVIRKYQEKDPDSEIVTLKRRDKTIGSIPMKGEPHKMFTFCTRTVYLGADFYSTNARTFIFSDSNVDCLSVDISLDLEQILGRQRLDENPWRNMATLYVKTTSDKKKTTKEEFQTIIDRKIGKSNNLLRSYSKADTPSERHDLADNYQKVAKTYHYRDDYVAVNEHAGGDLIPVFNNLMLLSEMRAFEVQQEDYADRFTVLNTVDSIGVELVDKDSLEKDVLVFLDEFNKIKFTKDKLKYLTLFYNDHINNKDVLDNVFNLIPLKYKDYFTVLGPDRIKALSYQELDIKRELKAICGNDNLQEDVDRLIYETFSIGLRQSNTWLKDKIKNIYESIGYQKTPKANILDDYFSTKPIKIREGDKWVHGLEIVAKK